MAIRIIGMGNEFRHDDGVGLLVLKTLQQENLPNSVELHPFWGDGTQLMSLWDSQESVMVIDAVQSGSAPGTIHHIDAIQQSVPKELANYSTHSFSLAETMALSRKLGQLPQRLLIYGIEGQCFELGEGLTPSVQKAIGEVKQLILYDLQNWSTYA